MLVSAFWSSTTKKIVMALLEPKEWKAAKRRHKGDLLAAAVELIKADKMDRFDLDFIINTEIVAPVTAAVHSGNWR
jgi:hypothetical protein